jgi:hypothetical protein
METASDPERSQLELEGIEWARVPACVAVIHLERLWTPAFERQHL